MIDVLKIKKKAGQQYIMFKIDKKQEIDMNLVMEKEVLEAVGSEIGVNYVVFGVESVEI